MVSRVGVGCVEMPPKIGWGPLQCKSEGIFPIRRRYTDLYFSLLSINTFSNLASWCCTIRGGWDCGARGCGWGVYVGEKGRRGFTGCWCWCSQVMVKICVLDDFFLFCVWSRCCLPPTPRSLALVSHWWEQEIIISLLMYFAHGRLHLFSGLLFYFSSIFASLQTGYNGQYMYVLTYYVEKALV